MKRRSSVQLEPMERSELERRVVKIIVANLCIEPAKASVHSSFVQLSYKELGADRLDLYAIMMDLEEELGVSIPDRVSQRFIIVEDTVDFLARCVRRTERGA